MYWVAVIAGFAVLRFKETKGHLPFLRGKKGVDEGAGGLSPESSRSLEKEKEGVKRVDVVETPVRTISE